MPTTKELLAADPGKLPPATLAEVYHKGTYVIGKFVYEKIRPMIDAIMAPNDREKAVIGTFQRMAVWIDSLVKLGNEAVAFQGVSAATRGNFELLMDLKLIEADQTGAAVEKFHAFTEVQRFSAARKFVNYKDRNPNAKQFTDKAQRGLVNKAGEAARIEAMADRFWGRDKKNKVIYPDHWTSQKARARAEGLGEYFGEMYCYLYPMTSWNIHPSLVGQGGMKLDTFHRYVALFNSFSQKFFLDGLDILLNELKLDIAIQDLRAQLDELGIRAGAPLIQALVDKINTDNAAAAQAPVSGAPLAPTAPPVPPNP